LRDFGVAVSERSGQVAVPFVKLGRDSVSDRHGVEVVACAGDPDRGCGVGQSFADAPEGIACDGAVHV